MNTVKVKVFGAGSLEIDSVEPKKLLNAIMSGLEQAGFSYKEIKRGPRPKVKNEEKVSA